MGRRARLAIAALCALALSGCGAPRSTSQASASLRIVSLDVCADQYVLQFAEPSQIVALSADARKSFSYLRKRARSFQHTRGVAEDVLARRPSLVVRAYGGEPHIESLLARAGIPVLRLDHIESFPALRAETVRVATALGQAERGRALVAEMDSRLARIDAKAQSPQPQALYLSSGGATTGPGTFVHELIVAAGYRNYIKERGWRALPLESLAALTPDAVATSFFEDETAQNAWTVARHPVARRALQERPVIALDGAWTACPAWYALDAVEALARARE